MKTNRGFEIHHFKDDYGADCSIQESSSVEPHIWLGVHKPEITIMAKDVFLKTNEIRSQIHFIAQNPDEPEVGWYNVILPKEINQFSRMHLNRKQAKELAKQLNYFARTGRLRQCD